LAGGDCDQITHLLLTLDHGRLYLNTSAGAVAAIDADTGHMRWLTIYPRAPARTGNPDYREHHLFRDLAPCLAWQDYIISAPADCDRLFALFAGSGELAWALPLGAADDAVHLLGVQDNTLVASGDSLYWIDVYGGRLQCQFPPGRLGGDELAAPSPRGLGRGLIVGQHVWWPTRDAIYVFQTQPQMTDFGWQPRPVRQIPLSGPQSGGGNLVIAGDVVLVAAADQLIALGH
jgi:hypothetical protein